MQESEINNIQIDTQIDTSKTFASFVSGASNILAVTACKELSESNKVIYQTLYIYSESGLGKTHLLHAMANEIKVNRPKVRITIITLHDFIKEMSKAVREKTRDIFQDKYINNYDILMIDDIQEIRNKKGTQDEVFHIVNHYKLRNKQKIFTSDKMPSEIEGIEARIRTRLQGAALIEIRKPNLETRIKIIKNKALEVDIYLRYDVICLIASNIVDNIMEIEGAVMKLKIYSEMLNIQLDTQVVKEVLSLGPIKEKEISIESIIKITSAYFKLSAKDLVSKCRIKPVANARYIAIYLARKKTCATHLEIAKSFNRNYSTSVAACKEVKIRLKQDQNLQKDMTIIETNLS